ncbi:MAG: DUF721 domain-containing protein [Rhodospirillaceae bacterium]|nr:DUF721 domain-containing protein [Rhodospirillaceae bacterium]MCK5546082.1 DUF721 domain-containing protein [Rhodospirillaceae bacterium]
MESTPPDPKKSRKHFRPKRGAKRGAKRGGGAKLLSRMVERMIKPVFGKRGFSNGAIINNWPDIVGPELAKLSAPEKLTFSRDGASGGILHLKTVTGGMATEIQHLEPIIIERINRHFGYKAVVGLRLSQGPIPETKQPPQEPRELSENEERHLSESLSGIDDEEIRQALENLGKSIAKRTPENS